MCKFHKDVARDIATDANGEFDAAKYSVALLAMAKFRIEQYMPAMHGCDGFVPAQMVTDVAVKALAESGLNFSAEEIAAYRAAHIEGLRAAMTAASEGRDMTLAGLNIPDIITREGYKHCAKMAPDPTKNGPFLDEAVVQLFKGYDDAAMTWARGNLDLIDVAHKPEFEPIRAAAAQFLAQPGVAGVLKQMFEHSLVSVFEAAKLAPVRDIKTDGCVMCGHGSRKPAP